jgi:hypothetical protein
MSLKLLIKVWSLVFLYAGIVHGSEKIPKMPLIHTEEKSQEVQGLGSVADPEDQEEQRREEWAYNALVATHARVQSDRKLIIATTEKKKSLTADLIEQNAWAILLAMQKDRGIVLNSKTLEKLQHQIVEFDKEISDLQMTLSILSASREFLVRDPYAWLQREQQDKKNLEAEFALRYQAEQDREKVQSKVHGFLGGILRWWNSSSRENIQ